MNELDILKLFYDEIKARGVTRNDVFLNIDEAAAGTLSEKLKQPVSLEEAQRLTDVCIANEWLERTTIDPGYNFLSLSEAGLQIVLLNEYT
ncbi:hypothetical protein DIZ81_03620 [Legionella taurinensis]|uniref:Uncharacterized protein n=1 Tax=Legionella taurinensis TaxID=70611 RepID=A0A3A5L159_9GAMM|nr:hypothetical protein [Legionella taurinensis]MDX1836753.1 hypothetical protein [Legionella taurinensis]PUT41176.1 hypothetical protein DB744_03620 [Legionella taurinensis]PUT42301.1 hypothetical protein DB746_07550 [Legionella taurinensis]PUT43826.1 hypothetical protein DB743_09500 [Legionella taurinensis]PUT47082.1 hypothetical protein DB745_08630 [Legionella taurinensis]